MTELVMNEIAQAKTILNTGDFGKKPGVSLFLVARYLNQVLGLDPREIEARITNIMFQTVPGFIESNWRDKISSAAEQSANRPLICIKSIPITQAELDRADGLPTVRLKRLAFTMIAIAKYYNRKNGVDTNWVNCEPSQVFKMACISATKAEQAMMYRELTDAGVIGFSGKTGNVNACVLVVDNEGSPVVDITDMRNIGHTYQMIHGKNYAICERCGITFKNSKQNNRKYCIECAGWHPVERRHFTCCDCGRDVFVVSRNSKSTRCSECQTAENNRKKDLYRLRRSGIVSEDAKQQSIC